MCSYFIAGRQGGEVKNIANFDAACGRHYWLFLAIAKNSPFKRMLLARNIVKLCYVAWKQTIFRKKNHSKVLIVAQSPIYHLKL